MIISNITTYLTTQLNISYTSLEAEWFELNALPFHVLKQFHATADVYIVLRL